MGSRLPSTTRPTSTGDVLHPGDNWAAVDGAAQSRAERWADWLNVLTPVLITLALVGICVLWARPVRPRDVTVWEN